MRLAQSARRAIAGAVAACGFLGACSLAQSTTVTYAFSSGNRAASAAFSDTGINQLTVVLTNTSLADVLVPTDLVTAVFFDLTGGPTLSSVSAVLGPGSTVFYDPQGQPAGGVVGGEWGYGAGLSGAPGGASRGISSTGLGLFGGATFPGPDLALPVALDGPNYGILSAGDIAGTGNSGVVDKGGQIKNAVVFTLSYTGPDNALDLTKVSNVWFLYGTSLSEPKFSSSCVDCPPSVDPPQVVPLPSAVILFGTALAGLSLLGVRRRRPRTPL